MGYQLLARGGGHCSFQPRDVPLSRCTRTPGQDGVHLRLLPSLAKSGKRPPLHFPHRNRGRHSSASLLAFRACAGDHAETHSPRIVLWRYVIFARIESPSRGYLHRGEPAADPGTTRVGCLHVETQPVCVPRSGLAARRRGGSRDDESHRGYGENPPWNGGADLSSCVCGQRNLPFNDRGIC